MVVRWDRKLFFVELVTIHEVLVRMARSVMLSSLCITHVFTLELLPTVSRGFGFSLCVAALETAKLAAPYVTLFVSIDSLLGNSSLLMFMVSTSLCDVHYWWRTWERGSRVPRHAPHPHTPLE